jgi:hypothetical protein
MTVNGRDQATAILSGTDALLVAAEAAQQVRDIYHEVDEYRRQRAAAENKFDEALAYMDVEYRLSEAVKHAQIAEAMSVYAATVGKWAAR